MKPYFQLFPTFHPFFSSTPFLQPPAVVNWESYVSSKLISAEDCNTLLEMQRSLSASSSVTYILKHQSKCYSALIHSISSICSTEALAVLLSLVETLFVVELEHCSNKHQLFDDRMLDALHKCVCRRDVFISLKSGALLASLVCQYLDDEKKEIREGKETKVTTERREKMEMAGTTEKKEEQEMTGIIERREEQEMTGTTERREEKKMIKLKETTVDAQLDSKLSAVSIHSVSPDTYERIMKGLIEWTQFWFSKYETQQQLEIVCMSLSLLAECSLFIAQFERMDTGSAEEILKKMLRIISDDSKAAFSTQHTYLLLVTFWLMVRSDTLLTRLIDKLRILPVIVEVLKSTGKEKILRITLRLVLRILQSYPQQSLYRNDAADELYKRLRVLTERIAFVDEEMNGLVADCFHLFRSIMEPCNLQEQYENELISGNIAWTPIHKNETFWKDHVVALFERNDFRIFYKLFDVLFESADTEVICICLHDIAKYFDLCTQQATSSSSTNDRLLKFFRDGNGEERRERLFSYLNHPSSQVQYYALVAVQKFMCL